MFEKSAQREGKGEEMKRDLFEKPKMVVEAAQAQRGWNWMLEILIFAAVFVVSNIAMMIPLIPVSLFLLLSNEQVSRAILLSDDPALLRISVEISSSPIFLMTMLFSEILMIAVVCLFCKLLQKRKMRTLGFVKKGAVKEYLIGLLAGFVFFSFSVLLSVITGGIQLKPSELFLTAPLQVVGNFLLFLLGFMIQGMAEEVMCRSYFMVSYARRYPMYAAVLANALVFAALHLQNSGISVLAFINLVLFGIFASVYFIRRGNIWGIAAFLTMWNLVQGNFYGIEVSGNNMGESFFTASAASGKELLNGGRFGLEGSICVTVVYAAGILLLYCFKNRFQAAEN